mgnify:CR=1 FL=1
MQYLADEMAIPPPPDLKAIHYQLPEEKIAKYPLKERSQSKMLVYQNGTVTDRHFYQLHTALPKESTLFFNNTKVIPARLFFQNDFGAHIEIFLLTPVAPTTLVSESMITTGSVTWKCVIGNLKKWRDDVILDKEFVIGGQHITLSVSLVDREQSLVCFFWEPWHLAFVNIVEQAGKTPLPPYLQREAEPQDKERYQTVYSTSEGAAAAPTAGLHFTPEVFKSLDEAQFKRVELTLHVNAGTFQPLRTDDARDHEMHQEQIEVNGDLIKNVITAKNIISVGTTSMRTLESLYWFGVRLARGNTEFAIEKLEIYPENKEQLPSRQEAFTRILDFMKQQEIDQLFGTTEIMIMPGYDFKVCDGLITNFHQPGSTLLLLISAFIGSDWEKVYKHALSNDYRFLSYGDSSLLLPKVY